MKQSSIKGLVLIILFVICYGCATPAQQVVAGYSDAKIRQQEVEEIRQKPTNVYIMPLSVAVHELGLATAEDVPEWTEKAERWFGNMLQC